MHPDLMALAAAQNGPFRSEQALAAGYTSSQIRARVRAGRWVRLRHGVLAHSRVVAAARDDRRRQHLLAAAAALLVMQNDASLSHGSAAIAWRLPLLGAPPSDVAVTLERQHRRRSPGLELHTAVTPPHHRARVEGMPVTSVARTISDLARSRPFPSAVVAADAALHGGLCRGDDIGAVIADCPVWPGIARTKRVLAFADRRAESPGESLSRVAIASAGFPPPELQVELLLGGRRVRVDFMWPERRLVGEFDGRVKYGSAEDLWVEKQREDLIRGHDYRVVRWVWADVYPEPAGLVRLLAGPLG